MTLKISLLHSFTGWLIIHIDPIGFMAEPKTTVPVEEMPRIWNFGNEFFGGDGFPPVFHPTDPQIYWVLYQNGALHQTQDGGFSYDRFTEGLNGNKNWDMPYLISRHNSNTMYAGAQRVFANYDAQVANWQAISPNLTANGPYKTAAPATMTCLDESQINPNVIIAGSNSGNVWITTNKGANWNLVSSGLTPALITSVNAPEKMIKVFSSLRPVIATMF
ncbi:MAG: hypothetical protein IPO62_09670 [Saprospiraceae bacterium]|nr:hypothetical protein [Saprospiraceae bacterium]